MVDVSYQISQKVPLLLETQAATADNLGDRPLGRRVAQLRTLLHAKQPNTHPSIHRHTQESGGRQQSPCHLRLRPTHVGPATPHTQLSGPRPPWCPTAATEGPPELLQLCRTNTEISLSKKHVGKKKVGKITARWPFIWPCSRRITCVSLGFKRN